MNLTRLSLTILLAVFTTQLWGQLYPVTATLQVMPPYAPSLTDFANPNPGMRPNAIRLTLLLNDLTEPSYQVKLRLGLNGPGFSLQTNENSVPGIFTLTPGVPLVLDNQQLANYFDVTTMNVGGIQMQTLFTNGGRLPEGNMVLYVEALDVLRNVVVSNTALFPMYAEELDPPEMITPIGNQPVVQPQILNFTWWKKHIGTFPVRYTLAIYDTLPGIADAQVVELSTPLFSTQVNDLTGYLYQSYDPPLIRGHTYLVRVRAEDLTGQLAFKANGFSEVVRFRWGLDEDLHGGECLPPFDLEGQRNGSIIALEWQPPENDPPGHYFVHYTIDGGMEQVEQTSSSTFDLMEVPSHSAVEVFVSRDCGEGNPAVRSDRISFAGSENTCPAPILIEASLQSDGSYQIDWRSEAPLFEVTLTDQDENPIDLFSTSEQQLQLSELDSSINYSGHITALCSDSSRSEGTPFFINNTGILPDIVYQCGVPVEPLLGKNTTPIPSLQKGDTIIAGDFKVKLATVSGGNGNFSGTGVMVWNFPFKNFLNDHADPIAVNINFSDIKVNTDRFMYEGFMNISGAGLALVPPTLSDFLTEFSELEFVNQDFEKPADLVKVDFEITAATFENGEITLTGTNDQGKEVSQTIPWNGDDIELIGTDGKVYVVDADGNLKEAGVLAEGGPPHAGNTSGVDEQGQPKNIPLLGIEFQRGTGQYAFDDVSPDAHDNEKALYPTLPIAESEEAYHLPFKAIVNNQTDILLAQVIDPNVDPATLLFKAQSGRKISATLNGNIFTLELEGLFKDAREVIYATQILPDSTQQVVGVYNQIHMPGIDLHVSLLPMGDATIPSDAIPTLQSIYATAGVQLTIEALDPLPLPTDLLGFDQSIDTEGSTTFANYSTEQQAINSYVIQSLGSDYRTDTYYLLFTDQPSSTNLAGYMPLKRQFGYLFNGGDAETKSTQALVAAHELGHGIFALKHPFSQHDIPQSTTDWLMDYAQGDQLPYLHWDQIYNPNFEVYLFQGDEQGEQTSTNDFEALFSLRNQSDEIKAIDGSYTFITPSGLPITLPSTTTEVIFNTGDEVGGLNCEEFNLYPFGSLRGFSVKIGDKITDYASTFECYSGTMAGYASDDGIYIDSLTEKIESIDDLSYLAGIPCLRTDEKIVFQVGKIDPSTFNYDLTAIKKRGIGAGPIKDVDYIFKNGELSEVKEITASSYPNYSPEARAMLNAVNAGSCGGTLVFLEDQKTENSQATLMAFAHAHQISKYPGFFNLCYETTTDLSFLQIMNKLTAQYGAENADRVDVFSTKELEYWKAKDASIYRIYSQSNQIGLSDTFWEGIDILNVENAHKLFTELVKWIEYPCIFDFEIERRIHALKLLSLLELSETNRQEQIVIQLLQTTPTADFTEMLNFFDQEPSFFFSFLSKLNDPMALWKDASDATGYEEFIAVITHMVETTNFKKGTVPLDTITITRSNQYFKPTYIEEQIHLMYSIRNEYAAYSEDPVSIEYSVSPGSIFDIVDLFLETDIIIGDKIYTQDQKIAVPYFLADLLFRRHIDAKFNLTTRVILDFIAIATVPFTSGASTYVIALVRAGAIYGALDVFVAHEIYEHEVTGESALSEEAISIWNNLGLAIGGLELLELLKFVTRNGVRFLASINPGKIRSDFLTILTRSPESIGDYINDLEKTAKLIDRQIANATVGTKEYDAWFEMRNDLVRNLEAAAINHSFIRVNAQGQHTLADVQFVMDQNSGNFRHLAALIGQRFNTVGSGKSVGIKVDINDLVDDVSGLQYLSTVRGLSVSEGNNAVAKGDYDLFLDAIRNVVLFKKIGANSRTWKTVFTTNDELATVLTNNRSLYNQVDAYEELLVRLASSNNTTVLAIIRNAPESQIRGILDKLKTCSIDEAEQFIDGLLSSKHGIAKPPFLDQHIADLSGEIIDVWLKLQRSGKFTHKKWQFSFLRGLVPGTYRATFAQIEHFDEILSHQRSQELIGNLQNLANQTGRRLVAYDNAGAFRNHFLGLYESADPNSVKPLLQFMDDFDHFINQGGRGNASNTNVSAFIDEMMQSSDKLKAAGTSLEVIRNPSKYFSPEVALHGLEDFLFQGQKHRFDLLFSTKSGQNIFIYVDTKNYDNLAGIFANLDQIKSYLAKVESFDQFRIIQQRRPGMTLEAFKLEWQQAISSKPNDVFLSNQNLFRSIAIPNSNALKSLCQANKLIDNNHIMQILAFTK